MFKECCKDALGMLKGVWKIIYGCFKDVLDAFSGCLGMLWGCFNDVVWCMLHMF